MVAFIQIPWHTFARQRNGIQGRVSLYYHTIKWHFLTRLNHDDFPHFHLFRRNEIHLSISFNIRHIRTDIHQVRNTIPAFTLSISLEQFSDLKKEHYKNCLRKFSLTPWEEADAKSANSSYRHEEVLIKHISFGNTFSRFCQGLMTH